MVSVRLLITSSTALLSFVDVSWPSYLTPLTAARILDSFAKNAAAALGPSFCKIP